MNLVVKVISRDFAPSDLVGGHVALDLVNTVTARNTPEPRDWLDSYERLLEWAELAGIVDARRRVALSKRATVTLGAKALSRLKLFREALHNVCRSVILEKRVPPGDLQAVNNVWHEANERVTLRLVHGGVVSESDLESSGLDFIRDYVARAAVELLGQLPTDRTRVCSGDACGWLFIDSSKGGRRIWCDMAVCGNVAKSRRYIAKSKR